MFWTVDAVAAQFARAPAEAAYRCSNGHLSDRCPVCRSRNTTPTLSLLNCNACGHLATLDAAIPLRRRSAEAVPQLPATIEECLRRIDEGIAFLRDVVDAASRNPSSPAGHALSACGDACDELQEVAGAVRPANRLDADQRST